MIKIGILKADFQHELASYSKSDKRKHGIKFKKCQEIAFQLMFCQLTYFTFFVLKLLKNQRYNISYFFPKANFYIIFTVRAPKQSENNVLFMKKLKSWRYIFVYSKFSPTFSHETQVRQTTAVLIGRVYY